MTQSCIADQCIIAPASPLQEDLANRITDFLDKPEDAENASAEDAFAGKKRKRAGKRSKSSKKKKKRAMNAYMIFGREVSCILWSSALFNMKTFRLLPQSKRSTLIGTSLKLRKSLEKGGDR